MREERFKQSSEDVAAQSMAGLKAVPGKQTRAQALAAHGPASVSELGQAVPGASEGGRAGDWNMTPDLMAAMGLAAQQPDAVQQELLEQLQPQRPTQVANQIEHPPFSWLSSYEVVFTESEIQLKVRAKLEPQSGVTKDDILDVGVRAADAFRSHYDSKFIFTDTSNGKQRLLRCFVAFVESGEHYAIKVFPGGNAGTGGHRQKWFVGWPGVVCAHELGHQLALKDEYIDARAPDRVGAGSPGVHTDNSIMGNYPSEGLDKTSAKLRHGQTIAGDVGKASGHEFTVTKK